MKNKFTKSDRMKIAKARDAAYNLSVDLCRINTDNSYINQDILVSSLASLLSILPSMCISIDLPYTLIESHIKEPNE